MLSKQNDWDDIKKMERHTKGSINVHFSRFIANNFNWILYRAGEIAMARFVRASSIDVALYVNNSQTFESSNSSSQYKI